VITLIITGILAMLSMLGYGMYQNMANK
jgi:hypothetical protein